MIFVIPQGGHSSGQLWHRLVNSINWHRLNSWSVRFDPSCSYELPGPDNFDVNKLVGHSIGWNHHQESVRFGWRSSQDKIELSAYAYIEGQRHIETMCQVPLNMEVDLFILVEQAHYRFIVFRDGLLHAELELKKERRFQPGYRLWPYFGGDRPAPHKIRIELSN